MSYNADRITAGIKAFARPYKLEKCVDALINAGITNIRIGFDGPSNLREIHKEVLADKDADITIKEFPFNTGISRVRNYLVNDLETEYFLLLDDDQYVPNNILDAMDILDVINSISGVGFPWRITGKLNDYYKDISSILGKSYSLETGNFKEFPETKIINTHTSNIPITKNVIYVLNTIENIKIATLNNHDYAIHFDYIPNSAIFRSSLFNVMRWDNNFVIGGEHHDFFYRASKLGIRFGVSLDIFITHDIGKDEVKFDYDKYRHGMHEEASNRYFLQKHDVWHYECSPRNTQLFRLEEFRKYIQ